tara:strand:+ start:928 stop:1311 length:384 start_codon:yes stop_codon:yes gene_type:complete
LTADANEAVDRDEVAENVGDSGLNGLDDFEDADTTRFDADAVGNLETMRFGCTTVTGEDVDGLAARAKDFTSGFDGGATLTSTLMTFLMETLGSARSSVVKTGEAGMADGCGRSAVMASKSAFVPFK